MSTNKKWSALLQVVLALVLIGARGRRRLLSVGRSPVLKAFFERSRSGEIFPVRNQIFNLISSAQHEVLTVQYGSGRERFHMGIITAVDSAYIKGLHCPQERSNTTLLVGFTLRGRRHVASQ